MKKLIKSRLGTFLLLYGPSIGGQSTPWRDVPDFFHELQLYAYRGEGTEAERSRLRMVMLELIEEFQEGSK